MLIYTNKKLVSYAQLAMAQIDIDSIVKEELVKELLHAIKGMVEIEVNEQPDKDCRKYEASICVMKRSDFEELKKTLSALQEIVKDLISKLTSRK